MLVIMPLITGGALQKVLGSMGIRLPRQLVQVFGGVGGGHGGYGGGGGGYGREYERYNVRGTASGGNWGDNVSGMMNIAKMFI